MPYLLLGLILLALLLIPWVASRRATVESPPGRLLGFIVLFVLPALVTLGGFAHQLEQAKRTEFCLSCHEMEPYGQSLWVDDANHLPAAHYQNSRVPRDMACYTCHTHYTMFGDAASKWDGLEHLWVHFTRSQIRPEDIKLYSPYKNSNCLHCHDGARSYVEGIGHTGMLEELRAGGISCLDCHSTTHDVARIGTETMWHPPKGGGSEP